MVSFGVGLIGAVVAAIFFGSNYVPTKNYPQGDGMMSVWVFSSGVLMVGIFAMLAVVQDGMTYFIYTGILGGSLWAMGNLCVIPIVKCIGLGLGMLLWGSTSLITGFLVGKAAPFGLLKQEVNEVFNWIGFGLILCAMGVFFFIKPELDNVSASNNNTHETEYTKLKENKRSIQVEVSDESGASMFDSLPPKMKMTTGIVLAVASGVLYGFNLIPMNVWVQEFKNAHGGQAPPTLAFVFSHFIGIWLLSSFVFFCYVIWRKVKFDKPPQVYAESIIPAFISGAMWAVAQCGLMIATAICGLNIGFPVGSAGPLIVSSLWSVLYFREIRGRRNLTLLGVSFALLAAGITLLVCSFFFVSA
eukprot:TRINITY_DN2429_c0_g1_i1.p1 TRINITY_DN2429_c0_g1~~TRINITY_DN2429_c0_g1_i1.p1  ORF type:complete len:359 (-),score=101.70 TRINITY_DN2429_c0_g1_i1:46-1122(-)